MIKLTNVTKIYKTGVRALNNMNLTIEPGEFVYVIGTTGAGKSTFINSFAGKACTKTGNKPGVTKGKQWIKLNKNIELLDTPGILWPKFEDQQVGLRLALIGSIRDEILNQDEMAIELIEYLKNHYKGILADRYQVDESEDKVKILEQRIVIVR